MGVSEEAFRFSLPRPPERLWSPRRARRSGPGCVDHGVCVCDGCVVTSSHQEANRLSTKARRTGQAFCDPSPISQRGFCGSWQRLACAYTSSAYGAGFIKPIKPTPTPPLQRRVVGAVPSLSTYEVLHLFTHLTHDIFRAYFIRGIPLLPSPPLPYTCAWQDDLGGSPVLPRGDGRARAGRFFGVGRPRHLRGDRGAQGARRLQPRLHLLLQRPAKVCVKVQAVLSRPRVGGGGG